MVRLIMGNPLIMQQMARHVPDAGSYAPVTVLVDERPDGVHISYDRMASLLAPYRNSEALAVARDLDEKVEGFLYEAASSAGNSWVTECQATCSKAILKTVFVTVLKRCL